jgi:hypothetical protein
MKFKTLNILSIFIVISGLVFSQNYPVQTTIQLTAPYTSYLPDYTDGINSKLQVALNITDVNEPILQVKLKFTLEGPGGKIVTNPNFIQSPITLNFGEVLILSGDELSPYLAFENLIFPSSSFEQNYRQTKVLPEGLWKLCVDVIDATNPSSELLSMNNCALIFVARLQPPMLNIPICETTLPRAQNIFFSWTDMALGSQAIGQEPLYDFSLYSVPLSAYNNPTQVLNTNPIFTTTTTVASFSLDTNEVFLPAGQKYLWQVRAKLPDGSGAYLNNGYSAPCTFVFGDLAQEIIDNLSINLTAQGRGPTYGTASWTLTSASGSTQTFESYVISYRKAGNPYYGWYEDAVVGNQFDIKQLEDSTLYEVKIKGIIGESETEYTDIVTFRTLPYPSYACGDGNIRPLSPTYTPLANENAYEGIKVEQGQFFMEVTSIEPNGMGAGRFKGTGKIKVDFLFVNVRVSFDNLLIDSDYTARAGVVNVITQGLDEWLNAGYLNQVTPIVVSGTITNGIFTNETTVVVTTTDGTHTFVFENDLPIVVHGDGNVEYQFWADGNIVVSTFGLTPSADNLDASAQRNIRFKASPNQEYGFDGLEYAAWKNKHEVIICSDQFQYVVPHKSMSQQASDVVYAVLKGNIPDRTQISFKLLGGTTGLSFTEVDDSTYAITLPSRSFSYKIYAYYGLEKLGKLSVEAYETKTKKVRIVPISNVALNASQITNSLNKTYKDAKINFDVSIAAPYTSTLFSSQTLFTNPNTTLLAKYTEQMRQLRDEYLATNSLENDEYLLFSIAGFQDQSIDGYMVRGRALGFIKATTDTSQLFTTIAHELGHGIGGLRHSWDDQGPTQASTNNLMDYAGGRKLIKEQWEKMREPGLVFSMLDGEEDGSSISIGITKLISLKNANNTYTFLNVNGRFVSLPSDTKEVYFSTLDRFVKRDSQLETDFLAPVGALIGFVNTDNKTFVVNHYGEYFERDNESNIYIDQITPSLRPTKAITNFFRISNEKVQSVFFQVDSPINQIDYENKNEIGLKNLIVFDKSSVDYSVSLNNFVQHYKTGLSVEFIVSAFLGNTDIPLKLKTLNGSEKSLSTLNILDIMTEAEASVISFMQYLFLINGKKRDYVTLGKCINQAIEITTTKELLNKVKFGPLIEQDATLLVFKTQTTLNYPSIWELSDKQIYEAIVTATGLIGSSQMEALDQIISTGTASSMFDWINSMNECALHSLNPYQRASAFIILSKEDAYWSKMLTLIRTIPTELPEEDLKFVNAIISKSGTSDWLTNVTGQLNDFFDFSEASDVANFNEINYELFKIISKYPQNYNFKSTTYKTFVKNELKADNVLYYDEVTYTPISKAIYYIKSTGDRSVTTSDGQTMVVRFTNTSNLLNVEYLNGKIYVSQEYEMFQEGIQSSNSITEIIPVSTQYQLNPYELVSIEFLDNYTTEMGYQAGTTAMIPAFMLLSQKQQIENEIFNSNLRIVLDAIAAGVDFAAFLSSGFTLGGSLALVGATASITDIFATYNNTTATIEEQALYEEWTKLYGIVSVVTSGPALVGLGKTVVPKTLNSVVFNTKRFYKSLTELPAGTNQVFVNLRNFLRGGAIIRKIDDFIPSSGTPLVGNPNKTTTLLGRWLPDMQVIKDKMLQNEFNVGTEFGSLVSNNGGFNFLNITDDLASSAGTEFFNLYNKPWLEKAILRGDDIVLATRPLIKEDYISSIGELKGMYAEELRYLIQNEYKPINLSDTEWSMIKTWF